MISLLRCLVKVVEKGFAERLSNKAEIKALLSDGQCCSRKRRSAMDAAGIMIVRVPTAWREVNIMGVLLIDIEAVYPCEASGWLIHSLKAKQRDGDLIQCTES